MPLAHTHTNTGLTSPPNLPNDLASQGCTGQGLRKHWTRSTPLWLQWISPLANNPVKMKWIKSKNGRKPAKESPCRRQAAKRRIPLFLSKSDQDFQRGLIIKYALLLKTLVLVDNRNHSRVISNVYQQTTWWGCSAAQWRQWRREGRRQCSAPRLWNHGWMDGIMDHGWVEWWMKLCMERCISGGRDEGKHGWLCVFHQHDSSGGHKMFSTSI